VIQALREAGTPFVQMSPGQPVEGAAVVCMDEVLAAEEVTNLLISLGHRHIGFIRGAADQAASGLRYRGFQQAMAAHGLAIDAELVRSGDFTFRSGVEAAHQLLSRRQRPSAVFASNDDMALGVLAAAQRLGLAVPGDLSIAGFDDSPAAGLVWPALTTVRQPVAQMARRAVELLIAPATEAAEAADAVPAVLPHELLVRDSTSALHPHAPPVPTPAGRRRPALKT